MIKKIKQFIKSVNICGRYANIFSNFNSRLLKWEIYGRNLISNINGFICSRYRCLDCLHK